MTQTDKRVPPRQAARIRRHRRAMEKKACEGLSTEALEAGVVADLMAALETVSRLIVDDWPSGQIHLSSAERHAIKSALEKARQ